MLRNRGLAVAPTHDGLTIVIVAWPYSEFAANKHDLERSSLEVIELAPEFAERVRAGKRETRLFGIPTPNYFRKPYGPGWALVGDAGYIRDPITARASAMRSATPKPVRSHWIKRLSARPRTSTPWATMNKKQRERHVDVRIHVPVRNTAAAVSRNTAAFQSDAR